MGKAKKSDEQQAIETLSAAFPTSSVDSAFAALEAEAPEESLGAPVPPAEELPVKPSLDGLLAQVSSPPDEAAQVATGEAMLAALDTLGPSEDEDEDEEITPAEPAPTKAPWEPTHRVVTEFSVYPVMVVELGEKEGERSLAWTHGEYDREGGPVLMRVNGDWIVGGAPFAGNVHSLAPAALDRHAHRRRE